MFAALSAHPAAADDTVTCVQQGLEALGFESGRADGILNERTLVAAAEFPAATGFPMPPLTANSASEWCGILAGWAERESGPRILATAELSYAGISVLANPDPAALPRGIHFASSISLGLRRLILADLAWLAGLGPLHRAEALAALIAIETPLTGAKMVEWLVNHLMAIASDSDGCRETWVAGGGADNDPPRSVSALGQCEDFSNAPNTFGAVTLRADVDIAEAAVIRHVEDMHIVVPGGSWALVPVHYLNTANEVWSPLQDTTVADSGRLSRLASLFHEASHVAFDTLHQPCRGSSPTEHPLFRYRPHEFCDEDIYRSSYLLGGLVLAALAQNCECDFDARNDAYARAIGQLNGVTIPLAGSFAVPKTSIAAMLGLSGNVYTFVPPRAFFDVLEAHIEDYQAENHCPCGQPIDDYDDQIRALRALVEAEVKAGLTALPWSLTSAPSAVVATGAPEIGWGQVWLARALRAKADGYNVPLRWVVPCWQLDELGRKCAAE